MLIKAKNFVFLLLVFGLKCRLLGVPVTTIKLLRSYFDLIILLIYSSFIKSFD